tara:strand:- start:250 stop:516 length:267 start_codon:yes stop_codon:yes gene_type:complete
MKTRKTTQAVRNGKLTRKFIDECRANMPQGETLERWIGWFQPFYNIAIDDDGTVTGEWREHERTVLSASTLRKVVKEIRRNYLYRRQP